MALTSLLLVVILKCHVIYQRAMDQVGSCTVSIVPLHLLQCCYRTKGEHYQAFSSVASFHVSRNRCAVQLTVLIASAGLTKPAPVYELQNTVMLMDDFIFEV